MLFSNSSFSISLFQALHTISSSEGDDDLVLEGLLLSIALLDGGNKAIQVK